MLSHTLRMQQFMFRFILISSSSLIFMCSQQHGTEIEFGMTHYTEGWLCWIPFVLCVMVRCDACVMCLQSRFKIWWNLTWHWNFYCRVGVNYVLRFMLVLEIFKEKGSTHNNDAVCWITKTFFQRNRNLFCLFFAFFSNVSSSFLLDISKYILCTFSTFSANKLIRHQLTFLYFTSRFKNNININKNRFFHN